MGLRDLWIQWEVGEGKSELTRSKVNLTQLTRGRSSCQQLSWQRSWRCSTLSCSSSVACTGSPSDGGPDLWKCDDAHAPAGGRSRISSSDDTHVEFQDYGGHVAMVPGECDRKTPSVAVVLLCSSCVCSFFL